MDKTFYFLSGLPRSGNTLLSSILNQNPTVHVSSLSPVVDYLWSAYSISLNDQNALRLSSQNNNKTYLNNIINSYYLNVEKKIIIDRSKAWTQNANFNLIKDYINKDPKIIFTARSIIDILASLISVYDKTELIEQDMLYYNWNYKHNLSLTDNKCDFLMRQGAAIDLSLSSLSELQKNNRFSNIHIIEYEDLIKNPETSMKQVYYFLEMENYSHDFNNITDIEIDSAMSDLLIGLPEDLHKVEKSLKLSKINPHDILSEYVINKYSNLEFWRNK
jgi:sulfotransferase